MGNCLNCFKVPPTQGAPTNQTSDIDKQEMTELENLYSETSSSYVPTELNNHNSLTLYSSLQTNGNAAYLHLKKQPVQAMLTSSVSQPAVITHTIPTNINNYCVLPQRTSFYSRKSITRQSQNMGQGDSKNHPSEAKLNALFEHYKDSTEDLILADGIERLCNDLQVSPDEFRVLVLAWKLNAEQMCRFTREEFVQGCKTMRADSIATIQTRLPELVKEVERDNDLFKDLYRFTFRFGLDVVTGQRILPSDMAVCLWRLVFSVREPPILQKWLRFLEEHPHVRGIPRDTWNMFLNFSESVGNDLSCYDDAEAWPSLFDDFVEYENDKMNQNISKDKECEGDLNVIKMDE